MSIPYLRYLARKGPRPFFKLVTDYGSLCASTTERHGTSLGYKDLPGGVEMHHAMRIAGYSSSEIQFLRSKYDDEYDTRCLSPHTVHPQSMSDVQSLYSSAMLEASLSLPHDSVNESELIGTTVYASPPAFTVAFVTMFLKYFEPSLSLSSRLSLAGAYLATRVGYRNSFGAFDLADGVVINGESPTVSQITVEKYRSKIDQDTVWLDEALPVLDNRPQPAVTHVPTLAVLQGNLPFIDQHWNEPVYNGLEGRANVGYGDRRPDPSSQNILGAKENTRNERDEHRNVWAVDEDLLRMWNLDWQSWRQPDDRVAVIPVYSPHAVHKLIHQVKPPPHTPMTLRSRKLQEQIRSRYKMHQARNLEYLNYLLCSLDMLFRSWTRSLVSETLIDNENEETFDLHDLAESNNRQQLQAMAQSWLEKLQPKDKHNRVHLNEILELRRPDALPVKRAKKKPRKRNVSEEAMQLDPVKRLRNSREEVDLKSGSFV